MAKRGTSKKKAPKKRWFLQRWGTYKNDTIVCVSLKHDEITRVMRRLRAEKKIIEVWEKEKDSLVHKWMNDDNSAFIWFHDGRSILWIREWANDWDHMEILIHEIYHLVHQILHIDRKMSEETEGCAYQFEYLFHKMRKKLNKYE